MTTSDKFIYAVLSSVAYKKTLEDKYKQLKKYGLNRDYFVMEEFTDKNITTFFDVENEKIIMSFRGTDGGNNLGMRYEDLLIDYQLAIGRLRSTKRFEEAVKMLEKVIKKYGKNNISLCGHSLGGAIADYISDIYKIPAFIYNTGASPLSVINNPIPKRYTTENFDILSFSDKLYNKTIIASKGGHSLKDFIKRGKL